MAKTKKLSPKDERAAREAKRAAHRERVKARRAAKYDAHFKEGENVATGALGLNRGGSHNFRHGLYARLLTGQENEWAEAITAEYAAEHGITLKSDLDMLRIAVSFFIKACRPEPDAEKSEKDHNVRSYQAFYARQFADYMDRLGMSRKARKEDDKRGDMLAAVQSLFVGSGPVVPVLDVKKEDA